jgi:small membrane protein
MIFSLVLTVVLLGVIGYALLQHREFPAVARTLPFVCTLGIYVAWNPERTSDLATLVGVGRGTDLMLYVWVLVSALLILVLHLKLVNHARRLTELARSIAITNAEVPARQAPR